MFEKIKAFSLVELMISLITISLITAALAPVITKKLTHGGITIGSFGGGSDMTGKSCPNQYYFQDNECKICPSGYFCNGTNKIPCIAGTYALQGQTQCSECPEGYYSQDGAESCSENTATGCKEKSTTENICISCENTDDVLVDGNCVGSIPQYTYYNTTGTDVTDTQTEVSEDDNYWYIKIKASGTLSFQSLPTNAVDVFLVGSGTAGGDGCNKQANNGGGGNSVTEKNVYIMPDTNYPITIGSAAVHKYCSLVNGNTTSGFGLYAHGGVRNSNNSVCAFNEENCDVKYGEVASNTNQNPNTGNGGINGQNSMSGVVIIRGKKKNPKYIKTGTIPTYLYTTTTGNSANTTNSTLSVDDAYWYLKLTNSGTLSFQSLPTNAVDVFLVGGGAAGIHVNNCPSSVGGGGSTVTEKNMYVTPDTNYPITIAGTSSTSTCSITNGNTTSGFGLYAYGGVNTSNHSTCPFNETSCDVKYGNSGTSTNQNNNTGNGGCKEEKGMNGIVILRGKLNPTSSISNIPSYSYFDTSGTDSTNKYSTLSVNNDYWYLKLTASGKVLFYSLPSSYIDVFLVGGGAAGGSANNCTVTVGGGGSTVTEKNLYITPDTNYPITIAGTSSVAVCSTTNGNTTSGFGLYAYGGVYTSNHSTCPFNETSCDVKYGNTASDTNQNSNTGNGGVKAKSGMSGIVILRGKTKTTSDNLSSKFPIYTYKNSSGNDITLSNSSLRKTDTYWYLKLTGSGILTFKKLASDKIDVFVVGSGAAGAKANACTATVGGGGNSSISTVTATIDEEYPITIGKGVSAVNCSQTKGNSSSAFGITATGGSSTTSHSVCLFNESDCSTTYGNSGSDTNQNRNTGNGGTKAKSSMDGVVIIRGKL